MRDIDAAIAEARSHITQLDIDSEVIDHGKHIAVTAPDWRGGDLIADIMVERSAVENDAINPLVVAADEIAREVAKLHRL